MNFLMVHQCCRETIEYKEEANPIGEPSENSLIPAVN